MQYVPKQTISDLAQQIAISARDSRNREGLRTIIDVDFQKLPQIALNAIKEATGIEFTILPE